MIPSLPIKHTSYIPISDQFNQLFLRAILGIVKKKRNRLRDFITRDDIRVVLTDRYNMARPVYFCSVLRDGRRRIVVFVAGSSRNSLLRLASGGYVLPTYRGTRR